MFFFTFDILEVLGPEFFHGFCWLERKSATPLDKCQPLAVSLGNPCWNILNCQMGIGSKTAWGFINAGLTVSLRHSISFFDCMYACQPCHFSKQSWPKRETTWKQNSEFREFQFQSQCLGHLILSDGNVYAPYIIVFLECVHQFVLGTHCTSQATAKCN